MPGRCWVLSRLERLSPDPVMAQARKRTIEYLQSTLYEPARGAFLSFQEADTRYFRLDADRRATRPAPAVADKIFTDRMAATLDHLTRRSALVERPGTRTSGHEIAGVSRFDGRGAATPAALYRLDSAEWETDSLLRDYALVALVFQKASRHFSEPRYARIGQAVVESAIDQFHDAERGIFVDPSFADDDSIEYLMEMNAMLGLAMMRLEEDGYRQRWDVVESLMTYFSGVGTLLDRLLESEAGRSWRLTCRTSKRSTLFVALRANGG